MVYIVICNEVFTQDSEPDLSKGSEGRTNDAFSGIAGGVAGGYPEIIVDVGLYVAG